jgi:hypothetical protein
VSLLVCVAWAYGYRNDAQEVNNYFLSFVYVQAIYVHTGKGAAMKKNRVTVIRLPEELRREWTAACKAVGKESADLVREMIAAGIRYHSRNGNLYPPFELVPGARTPEERITYTVSAAGGVTIVGDNNGHVHVVRKAGLATLRGAPHPEAGRKGGK